MRVFVYSSGADTGGQGWRISEAFRKHRSRDEWTVDTMNGQPGTLGYPEQYPVDMRDRLALIERFYREADVVHLRNHFAGYERFDRGARKPIVIHHHGTHFRNHAGLLMSRAHELGATQLAATLDLTLLGPGITWLPTPYDLDELAAMRERYKRPENGRIRISHFPTDAKVKSTAEFRAAVESLSKRYEISVLDNAVKLGKRVKARAGASHGYAWEDVLRLKAGSDIYYDQAILGYGNNAIEAWGFGIPVLAGVADPRVRDLMLERFGGELPFVETTPGTIEQNLERLIQSAEMRAEYGARGLAHARLFHDERLVVDRLEEIYRTTAVHGRVRASL